MNIFANYYKRLCKINLKHIVPITNILLAVATVFLAIQAYNNINLTREIYKETNRPWLDIKEVKTEIDQDNKLIKIFVDLETINNNIPARYLECRHQATSGSVKVCDRTNFVEAVLPTKSYSYGPVLILNDPALFDALFNYGNEIQLTIYCFYNMDEAQKKLSNDHKFKTRKRYIFNVNKNNSHNFEEDIYNSLYR